MTTMPKFDALQATHDETLDVLRKWVCGPVQPGDFATQRQESAAEIRARNVACSPIAAVHVEKCWLGASNGESGV